MNERLHKALPVVLLLATIVSMTWAGIQLSEARGTRLWLQTLAGPLASWLSPWMGDARVWREAFGFSGTLLAILVAHEWGHWAVARRLGMPTSLPYLLPGPPPFGTFGAVIGLEARPAPANHLLLMAAAGPFAGMAVAVVAMALGLAWSDVRPAPLEASSMLGESLLMQALAWAVVGPLPAGHEIWLHPVAFAAWAGFLVTALNLMPFAQLDGGHIAHAMFGARWDRQVGRVFVGVAVVAVLLYLPWLLPLALLWWGLGVRHPGGTTDGTATGRVRLLGWAAFGLLLLTMTPRPFHDPALSPLLRAKTWWSGTMTIEAGTRHDAAGL